MTYIGIEDFGDIAQPQFYPSEAAACWNAGMGPREMRLLGSFRWIVMMTFQDVWLVHRIG